MKQPLAALRQELAGALKAKTTQHTGILFGGNLINALLSFVAVIIVSRHLSPAQFGLVGLFNSIMVTIVGITDLGLNTAAITLIARYRSQDPQKAAAVMRTIVLIEAALGALILLAGLALSPLIASLLGDSTNTKLVTLAMIAGAFGSMAAYFGPFFIAHEQYAKNAIINTTSFIVRTGLVVALVLFGSLNLDSVLISYTVVPVGFYLIGYWLTPRSRTKVTEETNRAAYKELVSLGKWTFLSYIALGLASRLDVLLLARFEPGEQLGLYYAALQLAAPIMLLASALASVFLASFNRQTNLARLSSLLSRVNLYVIVLGLGVAIACYFAGPILTMLFGDSYSDATVTFQLLAAAGIASLIAAPSQAALYALKKAHAVTVIHQIQLAILTALLILSAPMYGVEGVAASVLTANVIAMFSTVFLAKKYAARA